MAYKLISSKKLNYFSILILPLSSLYISLKHFRRPEAKNVFWLFCIFLGMIHIIFPVGGSDADGTRYAQKLIEMHQLSVSWENFTSSLFVAKGSVDIYQPLATYIVSLFTDNPHWLFMIFGIIFGFFYSRNMWYILNRLPKENKLTIFFLIIYFFTICPIWEINGVRMWTALHVFFYGALPYILEKDKSKIGWVIASLFFHFSFFTPVILFFAYILIIQSKTHLLITPLTVWFCFTFFIEAIDYGQVRYYISYLPDFMQYKLLSYTGEEVTTQFMASRSSYNFFVNLSNIISKYGIAIAIIYIATLGRKVIIKSHSICNLLCFTFFIYGIANILSLIPSGGRFLKVSQMFALPVIIFFFVFLQRHQTEKFQHLFVKIIPFILIIPIIQNLRVGLDFYGISIFSNPIISFLIEDNTPLISYIK